MTYEQMEDLLTSRLDEVVDYGFELQAMPDHASEISRPTTRSRITVAYKASRYGDKTSPGRPEILSLGIPDQEEFIEFSIIIESDKKRGQAGLYEGLELCRKLLHGWDPGNALSRIVSMTSQMVGYQDSFYSFEYVIQLSRKVVPYLDVNSVSFGTTEADAPPPLASLVEVITNHADND